jgi:hypothetical protein
MHIASGVFLQVRRKTVRLRHNRHNLTDYATNNWVDP